MESVSEDQGVTAARQHHEAPNSGDEAAELAGMVHAIATGSPDAFAALYDATAPQVMALARRITRQNEAAEEVLSDVYMEVWSKAQQFDARQGSVMAWLMTICRNRAIDLVRRRQRQTATADKFIALSYSDDESENVDCAQDLLKAVAINSTVHSALKNLSVQQQQLLSLAFFRDYSYKQIAEFTATPLGTVKTQIRRALQALRGLLSHSEQALLD